MQSLSRFLATIQPILSRRKPHSLSSHVLLELAKNVFYPFTPEWLCAKASGAILSQTPELDADHGDVDPGPLTAKQP
jgi:hypothetical protein